MLTSPILTLALGAIITSVLHPTTVLAAPNPLAATTTTSGTITGNGTISVVVNATSHSINYATGTPSQAVGCLNAAGKVVLLPSGDLDDDNNNNNNNNNCAVFTAEAYHVSTSAGTCSFKNASTPANTDAVYGKSVHAFTCWPHATVSTDTQFYTVGGLSYDFLGQGDSNLYYDIPSLPTASTDAINFWYFVWGGQQTSVPDGHYQALLLWEPVS